jgi:hypothetical protein
MMRLPLSLRTVKQCGGAAAPHLLHPSSPHGKPVLDLFRLDPQQMRQLYGG